MELHSALDGFIQRFIENHRTEEHSLVIQYDENWLSPCYQEQGQQDQWVKWLPVQREQHASLVDLEQALQIDIHPHLREYYTAYWSDNIDAKAEKGNLQLLFPWNQDDFIRLQQNLVGHVLMKRRLKQADTLFFAVTDEDDFILTVHNETGHVMLEQVGLEPQEILANSLAEFIDSLQPAPRNSPDTL